MRLCPTRRNLCSIRNQRLEGRALGILASENRRVDFAIEQHLQQLLPFRRAPHPRRIIVLGDVWIFEGDPLNGPEVDAVIFLQETSNPRAGRLRVCADTHPAAVQIAGIEMAAFRIEKNGVMLTARDHYGGHQHIRLAVGLRLQKCDNGNLGQIEFLLPAPAL